jgi:hypothetical protein
MVNVRLMDDLNTRRSTLTCIPSALRSNTKRCTHIFSRFNGASFSQKTQCVSCRSESVVFSLGCGGERT